MCSDRTDDPTAWRAISRTRVHSRRDRPLRSTARCDEPLLTSLGSKASRLQSSPLSSQRRAMDGDRGANACQHRTRDQPHRHRSRTSTRCWSRHDPPQPRWLPRPSDRVRDHVARRDVGVVRLVMRFSLPVYRGGTQRQYLQRERQTIDCHAPGPQGSRS